jgi:RHS repeat-associated protein
VTKLSGDLDTDFGYTGHYYHAASGLHLAPYRGYNPKLGRWLSRDPIEEGGGINLYGYVLNSPTSQTDRLGLVTFIHGYLLLPNAGPGGQVAGMYHMRPLDEHDPIGGFFTKLLSMIGGGYCEHHFLLLSDGTALSHGGNTDARPGDVVIPFTIPRSIDLKKFNETLKKNWPDLNTYNTVSNNCRQGMIGAIEKTLRELSPPEEPAPWWLKFIILATFK